MRWEEGGTFVVCKCFFLYPMLGAVVSYLHVFFVLRAVFFCARVYLCVRVYGDRDEMGFLGQIF